MYCAACSLNMFVLCVTSHEYSPLLLSKGWASLSLSLSEIPSNGNVMCDKYYFIIIADSFEVVNTECEIQTNKKRNEKRREKKIQCLM